MVRANQPWPTDALCNYEPESEDLNDARNDCEALPDLQDEILPDRFDWGMS
jgi:hypothetical protein